MRFVNLGTRRVFLAVLCAVAVAGCTSIAGGNVQRSEIASVLAPSGKLKIVTT
jgi:hypothetical protein